MFCPKCGKQIPENGRFCGACGTDVQAYRKKAEELSSQAAPKAGQEKAPAVPRQKKKFPLKKLVITLVCLLILGGAGFVAYRMLGMETVYLPVRTVSSSVTNKQTTKTEYDDQGRILTYETYSRPRNDSSISTTVTREYIYDDSGRIIAAELDLGSDTVKVKYSYDSKGHLESLKCDDRKAEVECDKEGRITEITWENFGEECSAEYSYHKNGVVKELELDYGAMRYDYLYDDQGNQIESVTWLYDEKSSSTQNIYRDGRLAEVVTETYTQGELGLTMILSYGYDADGLMSEFAMHIEMEEDGETVRVTIHTEAEIDGLKREFILDDITADGDIPEDADMGDLDDIRETLEENLDGNPMLSVEYDAYGNIVEQTMLGANENSTEYIALRVPRGYRKPSINAPVYFIPPWF